MKFDDSPRVKQFDKWVSKSKTNKVFAIAISLLLWAAILGGFFTALSMVLRAISA